MFSSKQDIEQDMKHYQAEHGNNRTAVHCLCLIHPIDPRGRKIGGIETHIRMLLRHAPAAWRVLMVGVDGYGNCKLGEPTNILIDGRSIEFLPVTYFPEENINTAATRLQQSITARFGFGLLRHLFRVRRAIGNGPATIELQRFEFAVVPLLLRRPAIQIIHGEGSKTDKMDSLIKKYWFVHRTMEETAIRAAHAIVCVNPNIEGKIKHKLPSRASLVDFMPVAVDTEVFKQAAFDRRESIFRVVFTGRLDEFKDPPTMFRTLRAVHDRLAGRFEFHYIGTSDPHRYAEFSEIEPFTVRHGYCAAAEVAAIIARCHAGILTSFFEGMPCYLLELLAVGRPVAAIRLPQYDLVVEESVSGALVERRADDAETIHELADRLVTIWLAIERGELDPQRICAKVEPFSTASLLGRHFTRHRQIWHASRNSVPQPARSRAGA
jgi:glycosyltransferase involved in cell wall biosynthesis